MFMHTCRCAYAHTICSSERVHSSRCASTCSACISFVYEKSATGGVSSVCVCVYMSVFPHNKACSLIFNAAETTTSTQSEPGEACFPAQTNLPCQQETILRAAVWNASKHASQHSRTLTPPNSIQFFGFFPSEHSKNFCRFRF